MLRILFLIILGWAIIVLCKRFTANAKHSAPQKKPVENIVPCAHCGLRVLENETQVINGRALCSKPECRNSA